MGRVATDALHCVIEGGIEVDSSLTPHYTLHFSMQSDAFQQPLQSTTFMVAESLEATERLDACLHSVEQKLQFYPGHDLNSNPRARSQHEKKCKLNTATERKISKHVVITIKNQDELCFVRAIVTMKARVNHGCNNSADDDVVSRHVWLKNCIIKRASLKDLNTMTQRTVNETAARLRRIFLRESFCLPQSPF